MMHSPPNRDRSMPLPTNLDISDTTVVPAITGTAHHRDGRLLTMGRPAVALGRRRFSTRGKVSKVSTAKLSKDNCKEQQQCSSTKAPLVGQEIHVQDPAYSGNRCSDTSGITLPDFGSEEFALYDHDDDEYEEYDDFCRPCGDGILEEGEDPQLLTAPSLLRDESSDTLPSMPRRRSSNVSHFSNSLSNPSSYHTSSYLRRISNHSKSENDTMPQAPGRSMSAKTTAHDIDIALHASFGTRCVIQEEETETEAETEESTRVSLLVES